MKSNLNFHITSTIIVFFLFNICAFAQLNESLYPLIQNISNRQVKPLDGKWRTIIDPFENGYYDHRYKPKEDGYFLNKKMKNKWDLIEYNFDESEQLNVPGDWNTQDEKLFYYEGTIWYKKSFHHTLNNKERTFIHFGAVNYEAIVYLNGKKIGKHTGGFTPFNFEITTNLVEGKNDIILKVDNKRKINAVPTVNTDWWNYGGITRNVTLVTVPKTFIRDYSVQLRKSSLSEIIGYVTLDGISTESSILLEIPELKIAKKIDIINGEGTFLIKAKPRLWSPENPKLYKVILISRTGKIEDQIGFRTIEIKAQDIYLNGESVFLKGISIHEEAPFRSGRAYSAEDAKTLLGWAKEMGCNFVRLAHYTHNENMIMEADRIGLMVWSEIPVYWTISWENEETLNNARNQLKESISRDYNRASIIIRSVANETPIEDTRLVFLKELINDARVLDNTRLISAASDTHGSTETSNLNVISDPLAEYLDVIGINYYCGWYTDLPKSCGDIKWESNYNKPVIVSEFGGGALQGLHGDDLTRWTEEYQINVYENNFKMLNNMPFLRGTTPWLLMDFYSSRRPLPNIQDNYNRKGLISERGIKKKAFYTLKEYYTTMNKI